MALQFCFPNVSPPRSRLPKLQARAPRKDVKAGVVESAPHAEVLQSSGNLQSARKQPERVSQASTRGEILSYLILNRLETERTHRVLASHQIRSGIELWKVLPQGRSVNRLLSIAIVSKGVAQNNLRQSRSFKEAVASDQGHGAWRTNGWTDGLTMFERVPGPQFARSRLL